MLPYIMSRTVIDMQYIYAFMFEFHNTEKTLLPGNQLVKSIPGISACLKYFYIPTQSWNSSTDAISSEIEFTNVFYMRNLCCQAVPRCTGSGWFSWWKPSFTVSSQKKPQEMRYIVFISVYVWKPFLDEINNFSAFATIAVWHCSHPRKTRNTLLEIQFNKFVDTYSKCKGK
jgi:hypothetical protein